MASGGQPLTRLGRVGRLVDAVGFGIPDTDGGARAHALAAVVAGFAAVVWFGWAQVSADPWLSTLLTFGSLAGFAVAIVGFVRAARAARARSDQALDDAALDDGPWDAPPLDDSAWDGPAPVDAAVDGPSQVGAPLQDPGIRRRYLTVLATEAVGTVAGAAVLALTGLLEWSPVWVCAAVGVHLVPLARVVGDRLLAVAGVLLVGVAVVALVLAVVRVTAPATVAGAVAGLVLLLSGIASLVARARTVVLRR